MSRNQLELKVIGEYMKSEKILIRYLKDIYGYRKGVVVALSPNHIGFSIVSSTECEYQRLHPEQLPVIKKMIHENRSLEEIVSSTPYRKCMRNQGVVRIPRFDLRTGFLLALDSARRQEVEIIDEVLEKPLIGCARLPHDPDLLKALLVMNERARKYYKEKL
jgi:hypothetical protein